MLTLNHVADEQAAILAACPRPRALAAVASAVVPSLVEWSVLPVSAVVAVSADLGAVAAVRPAADERPEAGYALRPVMAGLGFFAATSAGAGAFGAAKIPTGISERDGRTQDPQNQQDKQNDLTHRREPRTWRPPH